MTGLAKLEVGQFVEFVERPARVKPVPKVHYMLRLHPNYEMKAERQLHERDIDAYLPKETRSVKGTWNRRVLRSVPIFSGIMFIPDYDANLIRLKDVADGIGGFVKVAGQALEVSADWMSRIRKFELKMQVEAPKRRMFHLDQAVRITSGPFEMWEGRIARLDSHHRLRVLLTIMEREVAVEFDEDQVEAV